MSTALRLRLFTALQRESNAELEFHTTFAAAQGYFIASNDLSRIAKVRKRVSIRAAYSECMSTVNLDDVVA